MPVWMTVMLGVSDVQAQPRISIPKPVPEATTAYQPGTFTPAPPTLQPGGFGGGATLQPGLSPGPSSTLPPITATPGAATLPPSLAPSGATLGSPMWDPYAPGGVVSPPATMGAPLSTAPPTYAAPPGIYQPGAYPATAYPAATPALFPGGVDWSSSLRVVQPRLQYAWLPGDAAKAQELDVNEIETSAVFTWPNFLFTGQPIYIVPSFALTLFEGPKANVAPPGPPDLPPMVYAAFLDAAWTSDPCAQLGVELGARIGVYSDFNTLTSDSVRPQGKALLRYRLSPTMTIRGGAIYANRAEFSVLPAGGLLWEPDQHSRYDIYFPKPKLSHYLTTLGNNDLWVYLGAEYGGSRWTIERATTGITDLVDYHDIRAYIGLEFGPPDLFARGQRFGFVELGWVFDRGLDYDKTPADNTSLKDTFMVRGGLYY